jgi:hypothetical protein
MKLEFGAINFVSDCGMFKPNNNFPLEFAKTKNNKSFGENEYDDEKKGGFDPNAINLKLVQLVKMVHGNLEAKAKLIEDFNEQNPECSKSSIERKIKESFVKDKRDDDPRQRYYATEEFLL